MNFDVGSRANPQCKNCFGEGWTTEDGKFCTMIRKNIRVAVECPCLTPKTKMRTDSEGRSTLPSGTYDIVADKSTDWQTGTYQVLESPEKVRKLPVKVGEVILIEGGKIMVRRTK